MNLTNTDVRTPTTCAAVDEAVAIMGNKWTLLVLGALSHAPGMTLRHAELQRAVAGISQRMLTFTLRKLEENGLVERTVFPSIPPRVDYALTAPGRSLIAPVQSVLDWVITNRPALNEARRRSTAKTRA